MEYYKTTGHVRRQELLYLLLVFHFINEVSLQTVDGFIGGSAVLPCSFKEQLTDNIEVLWRSNKLVYAIIHGKGSVEGQDPSYKNRAESFPEEYEKGNFSLKLNNLQHTDGGKYKCFIAKDSVNQKIVAINLKINDMQEVKTANRGTKPRPDMIIMIISVLCVAFFLSLTNSATWTF